MIKVLLLFSSGQLGGAERSLTRMALLSKSMDYKFATLDIEGPWAEWIRKQGKEPIIFGGTEKRKKHSVITINSIILPSVKLIHGIRWNPNTDSKLDRFFRAIERRFSWLIDGYITNSEIAKETLIVLCKINAKKINVIYNGIEKIPDSIIEIKNRPNEILTVANLNPRKGYLEYLSVIQQIVKVLPDIKFVFVGRDDMNGDVQKRIIELGLNKNISYVGFQLDVSYWFSRAKLFVLPSLWGEGCPTSILESFSWGVPVIAYRIDGVPELVTDNQDGFLVPEFQKEIMAKKIIQLLENNELLAMFSKNARNKVKEKFILQYCTNLHEECLNKIGWRE